MKKVMIALLSLAVLFAFTACPDGSDSSSQTLEDQAVVKIEVTGPDTYFAGETATLDDYKVVATRANGETFEVTNADDLTFSVTVPSTATSADAAPKSIGTIEYTGNSLVTVKDPKAEVYATVYNVDAINVVAKSSQTKYYDGSSTADLADDYVVTAYALKNPATDKADAALYAREVSSDDVEISSSLITSDAFNASGKADLTFKAYGVAASAITGGTNTASVIVYDDYLESISVAENPAKKAVIGAKTTATPLDYVVVTYNMASGKTGDTSATGATAATAEWAAEITGGTTVFEKGKTYTITVTAKTGFDGKTDDVETVTLTLVENTIVSFTVTASGDINAGDTLKGDSFTVTPTWLGDADSVTPPAEVTAAVLQQNLLLNGAASYTVPEDYPAGTKLPVKFTLKNYPNATCNTEISTKANS